MKNMASFGLIILLSMAPTLAITTVASETSGPTPLLKKGEPVKWWFVFKFNAKAFPACGGAERACPFGGDVQSKYKSFGQQFAYASSKNATLTKGNGCVGDGETDPVGATFDEIYNGHYHYLVWNDQFYGDPKIKGCGENCNSPWGHSKGLLAWNDQGKGLVMQVSTPSWPASASKQFPRKTDGNTLGCIADNDVMVSQHFFSMKLTKDDVIKVLTALKNASIATDPANPQIANNGGPADIQDLVNSLGIKSTSDQYLSETLSNGITLISKPSRLHVPPWQMVSSLLDSVPLRAATWWASPRIATTTTTSNITCWDDHLKPPGPVDIAVSGGWEGQTFGLEGGPGADFNHAKVGISTGGSHHYAIFGDLNQQGSLSANCISSQNGRGGLFYVMDNVELSASVGKLISGKTAPEQVNTANDGH